MKKDDIIYIVYPFGKCKAPLFEGTNKECLKFILDNGLTVQKERSIIILSQKK